MTSPALAPKGFDRYEKLNLIGKGGYGDVFAAWDSSEQKLVAIKGQRCKDEESARELLVFWAMPRHPNVLHLLDCFRDNGSQYLVLRLHNTTLLNVWESKDSRVELQKCDAYCEGIFPARPDPGPDPARPRLGPARPRPGPNPKDG